MGYYTILERLGKLLVTYHPIYGRQLWAVNPIHKASRDNPCAVCRRPIGDKAFKPVSETVNRFERICLQHGGDHDQPNNEVADPALPAGQP